MFAGIEEPSGLVHMPKAEVLVEDLSASVLFSRDTGLVMVLGEVEPARCLISDDLMRRIEEIDCLREVVSDFKGLDAAAPPVEEGLGAAIFVVDWGGSLEEQAIQSAAQLRTLFPPISLRFVIGTLSDLAPFFL